MIYWKLSYPRYAAFLFGSQDPKPVALHSPWDSLFELHSVLSKGVPFPFSLRPCSFRGGENEQFYVHTAHPIVP